MTVSSDSRPKRSTDPTGSGDHRSGPSVVAVLAVATAVALLVALVLLAVGGALAPVEPAIFDPGAVVRWGVPVARVASDLAAATTIGLLFVGTFFVPALTGGTALTELRLRVVRAGALAARCWVVAAAALALLTAADATGSRLNGPGFLGLAMSFWTQTALGQTLAVVFLGAAATAIAAATSRTVVGAAWSVCFGLISLVPLALGGHAAGSVDHGNSVDSLLLHLVGVCLWVGGLIALVVFAGPLAAARPISSRTGAGQGPVSRSQLAVVAARYSTLAGCCFALVAGSGLVNAYLRLGGLTGLTTPYGLMVIGKTVALVLLGVAGWMHRRSTIPGLSIGSPRDRWFVRLASAEVVVMAAAIGLAVALSRSKPPVAEAVADPAIALLGYPLPPPISAFNWLTKGHVSVLWLTVSLLLAGFYLAGLVKLRRAGNRLPWQRTVSWLAGAALLIFLTSGGPAVYGRVSFSAHMLQHMSLMVLVPLLLVLGAPITLALRALDPRRDGSFGPRELLLSLVHSRYLAFVGRPLVAEAIFVVSLIAFYYTSLFELAMFTHLGHVLMTAHFLAVGYLLIWSLVGIDPGPQRPPYPIRLLILLLAMGFHAFFGLTLMQSEDVIALGWWQALGLGPTAALVADQQLGGGIAWGAGDIPALLIGLVLIWQWVRSDAVETRRKDRQADRDNDAELRAYNERLAALARRDRES